MAHSRGGSVWGKDGEALLRSLTEFGLGSLHHAGFGPHGRARRGDTRSAILLVLAEQPMHGYQIIQELSRRSDGQWTPSAGSVYPALQLLADEGLISAAESTGKRVYSLTDTGRSEAEGLAEAPAPWDVAVASGGMSGLVDLRRAGGRLAQAVAQASRTGDKALIESTAEILDAARKQVYALLAEN
ncbi:MAG: PadR family transcriptional regulator [Propionicimonas sp.]|uniref:PadR family transcriptional regulator n=1 Tax=Propionicimonas sp. TaxID=1955623 RepID=UPI003D152AF7